jgi:hypothetical protein
MDSSTVSVDHPIWQDMLDTKFKVSSGFRPVNNSLISASYISEAAASLLDQRLDLYIVPRTQLVSLSSQVRSEHV